MKNEHIIYDTEMVEDNEDNDIWFESECDNLDQELDTNILVIADLGLWHGRKSGYKVLARKNLNAILYAGCGDYKRVYVKGNDAFMDDTHHDGTNHYRFRLIRKNVDIDNLLNKIYNDNFSEKDVCRYTSPLGKLIKPIYGW